MVGSNALFLMTFYDSITDSDRKIIPHILYTMGLDSVVLYRKQRPTLGLVTRRTNSRKHKINYCFSDKLVSR